MTTKQKTPIWKGSTEIFEQPGYPLWQTSSEGTEIERRFEGPYEKILAEVDSGRIVRGTSMTDLGANASNYVIDRFRFYPEEGASGVLVVILNDYVNNDDDGGNGSGNETTEVEWVQLEKSISEHPAFTDALTEDAIATIIKAAENNEALPATNGQGETATLALYNRVRAGVTSYIVYAPVIRRTSALTSAPSSSNAGGRENPPGGLVSGDWEWLKTADRVVSPGQNSDYEQIEEWTGADVWDPVLYPQ